MKRLVSIAVLGLPSAAYGGVGFSDDGWGFILSLAFAMSLLTLMATSFLGRHWSSRKGMRRKAWSGLLVWGASAFPISVILGVVLTATSGHKGIAANLADSSTYFFGCVVGAYLCAALLPAMLVIGLLIAWQRAR